MFYFSGFKLLFKVMEEMFLLFKENGQELKL